MKQTLKKTWVKLPHKEQKQISRKVGVDISRINGYFAGLNEVRSDSLELLADSMGFELTLKTKP